MDPIDDAKNELPIAELCQPAKDPDSKPPRTKLSILGLLEAAAALALLGTFLGFAGQLHWCLDVFNSFRPQYTLVLADTVAILAFRRKRWQAVVYGSGVVVNLILILPVYIGPRPDPSTMQIRAVMINLHTANTDYPGVTDFINAEDPDLLVLIEVDEKWWEGLESVVARYPYHIKSLRTDNFGIALLSKHPLIDAEKKALCEEEVPTILATIELNGQPVRVIATHPLPLMGSEYFANRNEQLQNLAEIASDAQTEVILLGDLNTSPWSPHFRTLLKNGGLQDSRRGHGIQPTWPAHMKILYVPIDHVLVSDGIAVHDRRTGPRNGSDHLPVIVDLSIK